MRGFAIVLLGTCAIAALLLSPEAGSRAPRRAGVRADVATPTPEPATPRAPARPEKDRPQDPRVSRTRRARVASGVFVDIAGAGVPGVRVLLCFSRRHSCYLYHMGRFEQVTDAMGRYAVDAPRTADWCSIICEPPPGYARPAIQRVDAGDADVRFVLDRTAYVEGRVERGDGTPVHGAALGAEWDGSRAFDCRTRTDASGRFRLHIPAEVRGFTVVARGYTYGEFVPFANRTNGLRGDRSLAEVRVHGVDPGAALNIVLPVFVDAELHFFAPDGEPLEPGFVRIHEERDETCVRAFYCRKSVQRVSELAPGRYRFEFHAQDQSLAPASARVMLPSPGPIELHCTQGAVLKGRLLGADARGFTATWLGSVNRFSADHYAAGAPQEGPTTKVINGRFEFLGLAHGTAALYVHKEGDPRCAYVPDVRAGTESLAIGLETGRVIRGSVVDFDPARHRGVQAVRGAISVRAMIEPDATFAIVGLPPGRFRVELLAGQRPSVFVVAAARDVAAGADCVELLAR